MIKIHRLIEEMKSLIQKVSSKIYRIIIFFIYVYFLLQNLCVTKWMWWKLNDSPDFIFELSNNLEFDFYRIWKDSVHHYCYCNMFCLFSELLRMTSPLKCL